MKIKNQTMKIFLLASSFPDQSDNFRGIFNYRFVKQMIGLGQEVSVVFFRMWIPGRKLKSTYIYDKIKVTQVCLPLIPFHNFNILILNLSIQRFFGWLLLKKLLKDSDIIHSVYLTSNGIVAGYWAEKLKIPHIAQAIGSDVNSDMIHLSQKQQFKIWMKNIDGIITNSSDLEKKIRHMYASNIYIKTIYRGIHTDYRVKEYRLFDKNTCDFLYLGGLMKNIQLEFGRNTKGGITLMNAWEKAETELANLHAFLYFGGPDSESELFNTWKIRLKFPEMVKNLGKLQPEEVKKYLNKSDIIVIPSMEEGMPNLLLESQISGKVVIGSDAGGIPEVIVNEETGYLFKKGDEEALANLLIIAAQNRIKDEVMTQKAQKRIEEHFNAENYSIKVVEFYKKIMKECAA